MPVCLLTLVVCSCLVLSFRDDTQLGGEGLGVSLWFLASSVTFRSRICLAVRKRLGLCTAMQLLPITLFLSGEAGKARLDCGHQGRQHL